MRHGHQQRTGRARALGAFALRGRRTAAGLATAEGAVAGRAGAAGTTGLGAPLWRGAGAILRLDDREVVLPGRGVVHHRFPHRLFRVFRTTSSVTVVIGSVSIRAIVSFPCGGAWRIRTTRGIRRNRGRGSASPDPRAIRTISPCSHRFIPIIVGRIRMCSNGGSDRSPGRLAVPEARYSVPSRSHALMVCAWRSRIQSVCTPARA